MCSQREREAVDGNGAQIPPKQPAVAMPCTNTLTHLRKYAYKHTLTHVPIHKHKCCWGQLYAMSKTMQEKVGQIVFGICVNFQVDGNWQVR